MAGLRQPDRPGLKHRSRSSDRSRRAVSTACPSASADALLNAVASWPILPSSSATSPWFEVGRLATRGMGKERAVLLRKVATGTPAALAFLRILGRAQAG